MTLGKIASSCANVAYDYACKTHETLVKPAGRNLHTMGLGAWADIGSTLFSLAILAGSATAGVMLAQKAWNLKPQERNVLSGTEPSSALGHLAKKAALYTASVFFFGLATHELYSVVTELHANGLIQRGLADCDKVCYNFKDRWWITSSNSHSDLKSFLTINSEKCRIAFSQKGNSCFDLVSNVKNYKNSQQLDILNSFGLNGAPSA